jgi:heterotetrameric sarcosine oxidase gamma subunit
MRGPETTASRYPVRLSRGHSWCLFEIRGPEAAIASVMAAAGLPAALEANRRVASGDAVIARLGPRRWLLLAPIAEEEGWAGRLQAASSRADVDAVPVTDQFEAFRLSGEGVGDVLAQGSALDLSPSGFAADAMTQTDLFGAAALIFRSEPPEPGFTLIVERSFGDWLELWLHRAAGLDSEIRPANRVTEEKRQRSQ